MTNQPIELENRISVLHFNSSRNLLLVGHYGGILSVVNVEKQITQIKVNMDESDEISCIDSNEEFGIAGTINGTEKSIKWFKI